MLWHNKGQYQDILTKWLRLQDNFEFQDNWDPCFKAGGNRSSAKAAKLQYGAMCLHTNYESKLAAMLCG